MPWIALNEWMALNMCLICADVPLRNCSLTHSLTLIRTTRSDVCPLVKLKPSEPQNVCRICATCGANAFVGKLGAWIITRAEAETSSKSVRRAASTKHTFQVAAPGLCCSVGKYGRRNGARMNIWCGELRARGPVTSARRSGFTGLAVNVRRE